MSERGGAEPPAPRLLFDQNLAPALARRLADLYPGSAHVRSAGLAAADDEAIWTHAAAGGYAIVTKDDDFRQRSFLRGAPPQVIWTKLGNCTAEGLRPTRGRATLRAHRAPPRSAQAIFSTLKGVGVTGQFKKDRKRAIARG